MASSLPLRLSSWSLYIVLSLSTYVVADIAQNGSVAKAYPGTQEWPSLQDWQSLNTTLAGKLIQFSDPGVVCHTGPNFDQDGCNRFQENVQNASWVRSDPTITNWPQFAGDWCTRNASAHESCAAVRVPSYIVSAESPKDIQTALRWAAEKNVRVVIKNTGHDFLGRNVGYAALSIWTRHIRGIEWIDRWNGTTNRTDISGKWQGKAVRYGAGHIWNEIQVETAKREHFVVTGAESTVGAGGGWLQGGGHGPYSNQYGLGVEQVLEFEVVTPTGEILTTNEQTNPDLFWALRGGGASTYAIVTRVTYKTYPNFSESIVLLQILPKSTSQKDQDAYYKAMAYFLTTGPNMTDAGVSGYPHLAKEKYVGALVAPDMSFKQLYDFMQPVSRRLKEEGVRVTYLPIGSSLIDLVASLGSNYGLPSTTDTALKRAEGCGFPFAMGSRLMSREGLSEKNIPALAAMLKTILDEDNAYLLPYPNMPGLKNQNRSWDVGLNPAWKTSALHLIAIWNEGLAGQGIGQMSAVSKKSSKAKTIPNTQDAQAVLERVAKIKQMEKLVTETWLPQLDALSENHGAYINEASPYEKDWKTTFYGGGDRYERLLGVKRKYDPKNVLWCFPCVGGDVFREGEKGKLYHS